MTSPFSSVRIDGVELDPATASIPVHDIAFIRGYGVFEVVRGIDGGCVRLKEHIERLGRSADMLGIELPAGDEIEQWCFAAAAKHPDTLIRVLVSSGDDPFEGPPRIVVTSEPSSTQATSTTLHPLVAPWHGEGELWELKNAKTMSYANNFGATRAARVAGFGEALLIGRSGKVLEGPTFSVGWVVEEQGELVYETAALSLGILDSITRQLAMDAGERSGLRIREVEVPLEHLDNAKEVFVLSTTRDVVPVTAVGERRFEPGPATSALRDAMRELTRAELAGQHAG